MRRLFVLGLLLLTGCRSVQGPFVPRDSVRVDDPRLPISEQQKLARERLALPDNSPAIGPDTWTAPPGTQIQR